MVNVDVVNDQDVVALANQLRPVLLKLNRELRREVHSLGVSAGQVSLLVEIHKNPGIGVRELAARERVSPAAISRHVERLERAGLVQRTPDAVDRRRHGLTLSDEAERVLRSVRRKRTAWLADRLKGLSPAELRAVEAAVEPLGRLLEAKP